MYGIYLSAIGYSLAITANWRTEAAYIIIMFYDSGSPLKVIPQLLKSKGHSPNQGCPQHPLSCDNVGSQTQSPGGSINKEPSRFACAGTWFSKYPMAGKPFSVKP